MSQTKQTPDEVLDSLTGHEEMWIEEHFGKPVGEFILQPGMYRRTLIFVLKRREGINDDDARNLVMDMKLRDVLEFFLRPDAVDEDEVKAVEESGKDEPEIEPEPQPSLSSVS